MLKNFTTLAVILTTSMTVLLSPVTLAAEGKKAQKGPPKAVCPGALINGQPRKTMLVGPSVGKKKIEAFEAYGADDIDGAIQILLDIKPEETFEKADISLFVARMYAQKGDGYEKTIEYLKEAVKPNILNEKDQAEAILLLADLQLQEKYYKESISNYYKWMEFSCQEDGNVWMKITNAHYELKQLDQMIEPADKSIKAFGDKQIEAPYLLKLTSYYERKKNKEAIEVLETGLQLFPSKKLWWVQLGMFYLLVEDYKKSLATLDLAYKQGFLVKENELKPLIQLYATNEQPYKAAALIEKHLKDGSLKRDDKNLELLANSWHQAMHVKKAAKAYGDVAALTKKPDHYDKQGSLYIQDEQFKKGIDALNKAIELGGKNPGRLHMTIAQSYYYLENYKMATKAAKEATKYPQTKKTAKSWLVYISEAAKRKGKSI